MKLASKIILLLIVAVVAVTTLSSYFTSQQFITTIERQHQEIVDSLALLQADERFHRSLNDDQSLYLMQKLKSATDQHTHVKWSWMSRETSVYANGEIHTRKTIRQTLPNGTSILATYFPMQSGDRQGYFQITSPLDVATQQTWRTWRNAVISIAAIGLLAIGVVMIGGVQMIARPLEQLTEKMHRIGKGDFTGELQIHTNDELGQLSVALNEMCARLEIQQRQIRTETEKRIRALEQLRHADRLKTLGQLAAGFAHEVGTPLNVIGARAEMILEDDISVNEIRQHANEIKCETARISEIIQKLLDFARRSESHRSVQDLRLVIDKSVSLMGPIVRKQGIKLQSDVISEPADAAYDFGQMQQVLLNLIDNAVDASKPDTIINITLGKQEDYWLLQVIDQGQGMTESQAEQIFEPFFTTKEIGQGTGLGLSIVHGIVSEHGGTISVDSQPGQGTTVSIRLPVAERQKS